MHKRSKKLQLTREAVRALSADETRQVAGAEVTIGFGSCNPYPSQEPCSALYCGNSGGLRCY